MHSAPAKRALTPAASDTSPVARKASSAARSGTAPTVTRAKVEDLPLAQAHELLRQLSDLSPSNATAIDTAVTLYQTALERQRREAPSIDFDHYSKSLWKALNITHARKSGSKQFEAGLDVAVDVSDAVKDILAGCERSDRFPTRLSAFETMRKISKSIVLCEEGEIRSVVMQDMAVPDLAKGMAKVLGLMRQQEGEEEALRDEGIVAKLRELHTSYERYGMDDFAMLAATLA